MDEFVFHNKGKKRQSRSGDITGDYKENGSNTAHIKDRQHLNLGFR